MTLPSYVGRYEIRDEIASGGFAVVVQAWDEELCSFVALKILHPELTKDKELKKRFLEEARLLRRVRAPNVVTVHDVGRLNDGRPYFVLDFADRGTLEPRLLNRSGTITPDSHSIMALVDALADGLSALHEAGLVHRDIKPANILFQLTRRGSARNGQMAEPAKSQKMVISPDERILLGDLGIAKDILTRGSFPTLIGGTPLYRAPEQIDQVTDVTLASDVYAATAILWHLLTGQRPPDPNLVTGQLVHLPTAWHEVIETGMALDPVARFSSMESWRSAAHAALAQVTADTQLFADSDVRAQAHCPYKGLAAYQPQDARFFFGRETLIDELLRRIQLHRILVVGGPSGSGKSSLIRAGLIPALHAGALLGSDKWRITLFTPGRDPLAELHYHITRSLPTEASIIALEALLNRPSMAHHLGSSDDSDTPLLLCIDQLEELFTLAPVELRDKFFTALSAMTDPADSSVRIVIAVRADFYGSCAQIPWLAGHITRNQVLVGPMTKPELRRAIREPARRAGLHLESGLVEAIIDEAGNEAGALPLIAHALVETWIRRKDFTLTLEGFHNAGGVTGAISQTADAAYKHLFDSNEQSATKRLFLLLVNPGEATPDTRRLFPIANIDQDSDPLVMHRVVERLTEARLLTVDDTNIQIAHEALLRTWPRLHEWIEESRDDLRMRQRISRVAAEWNAENRDSDLLYRGTPLLSALEWADKNSDQLNKLEHAFLAASAETRERSVAAAAERARKTRRIRRFAIALLIFLTVGTTAASIVALLKYREAQRNAIIASSATKQVQTQFAGALGAAAYGRVDDDPLLALALAGEAIARAQLEPPAYDARAALISARRLLSKGEPFLLGSPIPAGDALTIALNPDGSILAAGQRDGEIYLIDTLTRHRIEPSLRGHSKGVRDLDFAPHGRMLASCSVDGTVRLWDISGGLGGLGVTLGKTNDVIMQVKFNPDGTKLVSSGEKAVRMWDVKQQIAIGKPVIDAPFSFNTVAFAPDGQGLVSSYSDGKIYGWRLPTRQPLFEPITQAHKSQLLDLAFSPAGDHLATAGIDGKAIVIAYPSGRVVGPAFSDSQQIGTVLFTAKGHILIGGGMDGAIYLWDMEKHKPLASTPQGHEQAITDLQLSWNGTLLATLGRDQQIRLWKIASAYPMAAERQVTGRSAKGVVFSNDGKQLAAGDDTGVVHIWNLNKAEAPRLLQQHQHQVWALAFSPTGNLLASGDRLGQVALWNAENGALIRTIPAHASSIWSLAFTPDAKNLISVSDMRIRIWNVETGKMLSTLQQQNGRFTRAVLSSDGTFLATSSTDGKARIWNIHQGVVIQEIVADDNLIWSLAFSPDGRYLATASSDEVVVLWELATGKQQATFTGHARGATDVAFLADGVTLVAIDRSGNVHWWDAASGRKLTDSWQGHANASWRIAMHPDGERFATTGDDGKVKIWDQLSVARTCEIGGDAFDAVRRRQYLGEGKGSEACD